MRVSFLLPVLVASMTSGCSAGPDTPDGATDFSLPVMGGRQRCGDGVLHARSDAGDSELCRVPSLVCDPTEDLLSVTQCHYAPAESPANACCDARPPACDAADCDCLLRNGPWIDMELAEDAGTTLVDYVGPRTKCSYRVSCTPAPDGGVAVLSCTPA